jgi:tRNA pseudouridine38-40 synthase
VHALNQVVHFDTSAERAQEAWVRGSNRYLPGDIAVQWCRFVPDAFHSRANALGRRYAYVLLESRVRPALESGHVGWTFRRLDGDAMRAAGQALLGTHDFSAFRSAECQSPTPVKTLRTLAIERRGDYWRFDFEADAFLHHMIRNIMGGLVAVGSGSRDPAWLAAVLAGRDRTVAAATFSPDGLYFLGPYYDATHAIPERTPAMSWIP